MVQLIEYNPRIIIVRTFSKVFGMAGMRVGFIMAHPDLISKLEPNFFASSQLAVSTIAQAAAMECLKDLSHCKMSKQKNAEARNYAMGELKKMNLRCIPSYTNFLFFSLGNYAGDFAQDMLKKNVALRSNTYPDGKWCRLSIGTLDEMQQFFKIMKPSFNS
jgi:histidinol-phosphate aminotransferase